MRAEGSEGVKHQGEAVLMLAAVWLVPWTLMSLAAWFGGGGPRATPLLWASRTLDAHMPPLYGGKTLAWWQTVNATRPPHELLGLVVTIMIVVALCIGALYLRTRFRPTTSTSRGSHTNPGRQGYVRVRGSRPAGSSDRIAQGFEPGQNLYLGLQRSARGQRAVRIPSIEEGSGILGTTRMLKTRGQMAPSLIMWDGPAVSTSAKADIVDLTGMARERLAKRHGGRIHILDLSGKVAGRYGLDGMRIDPLAGCTNTSVVTHRVESWLAAADPRSFSRKDDHDFFRTHAGTLLRPFVYAAALEGLSVRQVIRWLNRRDVVEPGLIIERHNPRAIEWVDAIRSLGNSSAQVTVENFFQTALAGLKPLLDPAILDLCEGSTFDAEEFLATYSTLYIVDPRGNGGLSPYALLEAAQVDWIVENAFNRALKQVSGRCDPALLLNLDELPNICPLPSIPNILSVGGGQGVITNWACQDFSQLRDRYGPEGAQTILTTTSYLTLLGGLKDRDFLEDISALAGEYQEWEESRSGTTVNRKRVQQRVLPVEVLARLPKGEGVLLHHGEVTRLQLRAMDDIPALAALMGPPTAGLVLDGVGH